MVVEMDLKPWYRRWFSLTRPPGKLKTIAPPVDEGDAEMQFALGLMYSSAAEADRDFVQAARWYRKAADQDHTLAQFNLGIMFASGQGVPRDEALALTWTHRAAEGGDAGAQFSLGSNCHRRSLDSLQADRGESRIEAYKWYCLAAAQGYRDSATACESVALSMTRDEVTNGNQRVAAFVLRKPGG
jgi:TPR repeat protein